MKNTKTPRRCLKCNKIFYYRTTVDLRIRVCEKCRRNYLPKGIEYVKNGS